MSLTDSATCRTREALKRSVLFVTHAGKETTNIVAGHHLFIIDEHALSRMVALLEIAFCSNELIIKLHYCATFISYGFHGIK